MIMKAWKSARKALSGTILLVALAAGSSALPAAEPGGGTAADIAEQVFQAMGGSRGWAAAHFLRFDFAVEKQGKILSRYRHWWDRDRGRYRLEGTNKEGKAFVVLLNVQDRKGKAWLDGGRAAAEEEAKLVDYAYGRFINDTYWFLMPMKMTDPGVHLQREADRTDPAGKQWQILHLSFAAGIGLTPGDQYWAWIDPATHRMERWEYVLQDEKPPAEAWTWEGWKRFGPLTLSPLKRKVGEDLAIRIDNLTVSETIDESAFKEPA
jgi:hypothetical protein